MKKSIQISSHVDLLFGTHDENLRVIQNGLNVTITQNFNSLQVSGAPAGLKRTMQILSEFKNLVDSGTDIKNWDLPSIIKTVVADPQASITSLVENGKKRTPGRAKKQIQPKNAHQRTYMDAIETNDMVFGIGPAGTGKTYLAVAMAVSFLLAKMVSKIVLVRPAVEAGERLGFLPGSLQEKIDPYLRPLYDAMNDMINPMEIAKMMENGTIEMAPLAFMRGRTLTDAFVIMDEAQNTTPEQMKMFLTRMGANSKAVITGDITQIDLPNPRSSGLIEAIHILQGVEGIVFQEFDRLDVIRHPLVQRIVTAYESYAAARSQLKVISTHC